jgi:hypothetical protein
MICLILSALLMQPATLPSTQPLPDVPGAAVVALSPTMTFLVVPDDLTLNDGRVDMLLHLKGSPQRVHQALKSNGVSAVAIVVTDGGLSKAYTERFADPESLQRLLDEAMGIVRQRPDVPDDAEPGRLWISSFSAGYAAVRELLKHDRWFDRIDGLLMLDSIYAGYVSETERRPIPEQLAGYVRFAKAARDGGKTMVVTHTRLTPGSYASTWETADVLLAETGVEAKPEERELAPGLKSYRVASRGSFHVIGTVGEDGGEHGRHLANMGLWVPMLVGKKRP